MALCGRLATMAGMDWWDWIALVVVIPGALIVAVELLGRLLGFREDQ